MSTYIYRLLGYCKEYQNIENYELAKADDFKGWEIHHRLEVTSEGEHAYTSGDLINMNMYYNRPAEELIFLTTSAHRKLHNNTMWYKNRMSEAKKGHTVSNTTRAKIGAGHIGKLKGLTWKVIHGKRVWLSKEDV